MRERWRDAGVLLILFGVVIAGGCKRKTSAAPDASTSDAAVPVVAPAATCTSDLFPTPCGSICCPRNAACDAAHEMCTVCSDRSRPVACGGTCCAAGSACEASPDGTSRCVATGATPSAIPSTGATPPGGWTRVSVRDESCRKRKKPPVAYVINADHAAATKAAKSKGCVPGDTGKKKPSSSEYFCCAESVRPPL